MSTTTKKELIDRIAKSTQAKQTLVKVIIQNFLDEIISELAKGNRLEFRDFGIFETKTRAPRHSAELKGYEMNPRPIQASCEVQNRPVDEANTKRLE